MPMLDLLKSSLRQSPSCKCDKTVGLLTDDVFALFWVAGFFQVWAVVELAWLEEAPVFCICAWRQRERGDF